MFSFGSDPEFSVCQNYKIVSAIGVIPGCKKNKYAIKENLFYYDNVLAECNIKPGFSKEEVIQNIRESINLYHEIIQPYYLACLAAVKYDSNQLMHPDALEVGCDPEFCCYELAEFRPDADVFKKTNMRTAGGHIHVGHELLTTVSSINRYRFIRMMDLFVGIPSIFLDQDPSTKSRKQIYGEAGRFRNQKHGAEYRSLSNFWLDHPKLVEIIYDLTALALSIVENRIDEEYWTIDLETLKNDKKWKEPGFNPSQCHKCSYDVTKLKKTIKQHDKKEAWIFLDIIKKHMSDKLFNNIFEYGCYSHQNNLKDNWK